MYGILATGYGNWPVIKQIAWLFGKLMDGIYNVMDSLFNVQNIGVCIIILTVIVYTLLIPLTIKQQKSMKLNAVTTPEINKIRKKYEGKKDQASMLKQQEEMQAVHDKYGTSAAGGCLTSLIQLPILFALYPVIQNIPNYVQGVKNIYMPVVNKIMEIDGFQTIMETIGKEAPVHMNPSNYDYSKATTLVNVLYKFQDTTWNKLLEQIPSLESVANSTKETMSHLNSFLGISIGETPMTTLMASFRNFSIVGIIIAVLIPVLAGLTQFLSVKLQPQAATDQDNDMAKSMKTITYTMPLFSVFICFSIPAGLGVYWVTSAVVRSIQQFAINKYLNKISMEDLIEESRTKAEKKKAKRKNYVSPQELSKMATTNARSVETKKIMTEEEKKERLRKSADYGKNAKPGSLTSKANMVSRYNSYNKKDDKKSK